MTRDNAICPCGSGEHVVARYHKGRLVFACTECWPGMRDHDKEKAADRETIDKVTDTVTLL